MFNETMAYESTSVSMEAMLVVTFLMFILGCFMVATACTCDNKPDEEQDNEIVVFSLQL